MGRVLLVVRLALRDLRRRRTEAVLLLLAILAATTTLTIGLVVRAAAGDPYETTRQATGGPDVVATSDRARLDELTGAPGVTDHSGPFPVAGAELRTATRASDVQVIGRDATPTSVDQPALTDGDWVRPGGVVVEAAFAAAFDLHVGEAVTLNGRSFRVAGIAVTAAMPLYPGSTCLVVSGCASGGTAEEFADLPPGVLRNPGLVWLPAADVPALAGDDGPVWTVGLRLDDPAAAESFVAAHLPTDSTRLGLEPWQHLRAEATEAAESARIICLIGAWLLGLLAVATLSVLVGGRLAEQTRRVGLLKAVGGTPGLVAAVLLAEYLLVALVAAAAGLTIGSLVAPLLATSTAGLLGSAGTPVPTPTAIGVVLAVAVTVAVLATAVPALRAAGTSTVAALADTARAPRRTGWLIALSARLPVPLLLALRVAARRPRRTVLAVAAVAVTVSGVYVGLTLNAFLVDEPLAAGVDEAQAGQLRRVLLVVLLVLAALTALNAVVLTWSAALDNRHTSALARALGATPGEVTTALAAAQVLPALVGAVLGVVPGGWVLFMVITTVTGGGRDRVSLPPIWQQAAVVLLTVALVAALTAVPARLGGRRPVSEALRAA